MGAPIDTTGTLASTAGLEDVRFKRLGVQPPAALYVTNDDFLTVTFTPYQAGSTLLVTYRLLTADGVLVNGLETIYQATGLTPITQVYKLAEGYLLSVVAQTTDPYIENGQYFVQAGISNGAAGAAPVNLVLLQGYVSTIDLLAWPGSQIRAAFDAPGGYGPITYPDPIAGQEISQGNPDRRMLRDPVFIFTLATSADVAARAITFHTSWYNVRAAATQAASSTVTYYAAAGLPTAAPVGGIATLALPIGWRLLPKDGIGTTTANLQAADQYSALIVLGAMVIAESET